MNNPTELPVDDDLDDFTDELPPPQSQPLFENEPTSTQFAFQELQEICTPTQHIIKPIRQTQLENEFELYKTFNKQAYQQCKF